MALIRALNSGVSGLRSFQTKMDVIGNNIANVETIGYKSSRVTFTDLMNQRLGRVDSGGESSPQMNNQIGLGVRVSSIDRDFTQGVMQNTGKGTDLALEGKGYFLVKDQQNQSFMTRAGNFVFNKNGHLVDQGGRFVQGYIADSSGHVNPGGPTENLIVDFNQVLPPESTSEVVLTGNLPSDHPEGAQNAIKMSTTIFDRLGNPYSIVVEFQNLGENQWLPRVEFPEFGDPDDPDYTAHIYEFDVVTFQGEDDDETGNLLSSAVLELENFVVPNPNDPTDTKTFNFDIKMGDSQQGAGFTQFAGTNTAKVLSQDGAAQGQLLDVAIDADGRLQGIFDNGKNQILGQIALAEVQNENGLEMLGSGLFRATSAAGEVFVNTPENMSASVNAGSLEGSNVDLAKEFTEMITSQRAYQSNARVISTADEMLMEAVNLKR
ncbi:flagellar hook protein FlgE [Balneolaceae bacterium ANBcel3]|nr:flagellar hook protein FlgE [Balneolaceae bacterium ANBcel3]